MPGKRKRGGPYNSDTSVPASAPISAAAALKARLAQNAMSKAPPTVSADADDVGFYQSSPVEEEQQDNVETIQEHVSGASTRQQLCHWETKIISSSRANLTIHLDRDETIALVGCYSIAVVRGAVHVNGMALVHQSNKRPYQIFASSSHPLPVVKGLAERSELQLLSSNAPESLSRLSPLFLDIWNVWPPNGDRTFSILSDSLSDPLHRPLVTESAPREWKDQTFDIVGSSKKVMVSGRKSSGKSTFAKRLVNHYLSKPGKDGARLFPEIYYLDLDSGGPEYTPHGQISLIRVRRPILGPSFTQTIPLVATRDGENTLVRAHPVSANGIVEHFEHFLSCAEDLLQTYGALNRQNENTTFPPLIVNTPGLAYSAGLDTLVSITSSLHLDRVVHLGALRDDAEMNTQAFDTLRTAVTSKGATLHCLPTHRNEITPPRTDEELRSMHMQAYFHATGPSKSKPMHQTWNPKPLSFTPPWEVSYQPSSTIPQGFIGFLLLCEHIEPTHLTTALSGSLVQIVQTTNTTLQSRYGNLTCAPSTRIPYFSEEDTKPLDPRTSQLVCTALIRGFRLEQAIVELVVPPMYEELLYTLDPRKTVLVFGCCERPEWAYTEDVYYDLTIKAQEQEAVRTESTTTRARFSADDAGAALNVEHLPPWVSTEAERQKLGPLNQPRRLRKFLQQ